MINPYCFVVGLPSQLGMLFIMNCIHCIQIKPDDPSFILHKYILCEHMTMNVK